MSALPYPVSANPTGNAPLFVVSTRSLSVSDQVTLGTLAGVLARQTPSIYTVAKEPNATAADAAAFWLARLLHTSPKLRIDTRYLDDLPGLLTHFRRQLGDLDVIHATGGVVPPRIAPLVVTIHDLAFLHRPEHFTANGVRFMTRGFELARAEADRIVVPSTATADDCRAHGVDTDRLRIVPWGADRADVSDADRTRVRARYGLPETFVVFLGTHEPRKNLRGLLDAHRSATPDLPLVVAGPDGWGETVTTGHGAAVQLIGHVSADDLGALYDLATAFVYPSLLEGFGMPVLEAMAHGTAAITSATTSTAEVAGDTGVLIDPTDGDQLGAALASVASEPDAWAERGRRAAERAERFTWEATGAALGAVYDEMAA